jgi:hypothetical protein
MIGTAADVKAGLNGLIEHQFITSWFREGRHYYVNAGAVFGPYTASQAVAFVDGARAMGAGV